MRRLVVLLVGAAVMLAATGCGTGSGRPDTGRALLNTSWVCDALDEVLANAGHTFGHALGELTTDRADGDTAGASGASGDARGLLTTLAGQLASTARTANDPVLVAAVAQAGDNLTRLALDASLLIGVRTFDDLVAVTGQVMTALSPISAICR